VLQVPADEGGGEGDWKGARDQQCGREIFLLCKLGETGSGVVETVAEPSSGGE